MPPTLLKLASQPKQILREPARITPTPAIRVHPFWLLNLAPAVRAAVLCPSIHLRHLGLEFLKCHTRPSSTETTSRTRTAQYRPLSPAALRLFPFSTHQSRAFCRELNNSTRVTSPGYDGANALSHDVPRSPTRSPVSSRRITPHGERFHVGLSGSRVW